MTAARTRRRRGAITNYYRGRGDPEDDAASLRHVRAAGTGGADDATALAMAAFVIFSSSEHDVESALSLCERALELSPSCGFALAYGAWSLIAAGRIEAGIERARKALRISPFDPFDYAPYAALALAHLVQGQAGAALDLARKAVESNPCYSLLRTVVAASHAQLGRIEEAKVVTRDISASAA